MRKALLVFIALLFLFGVGCATTTRYIPDTPEIPRTTIEPPPSMDIVNWIGIAVVTNEGEVLYYALDKKEAAKLKLNVDKLLEYCTRCYELFGE